MKAEKKRVGIKAQIRAEKGRERRVATAVILAIILVSAALSAYFGYTILNPSTPPNSNEPTLQFKPENPNPELKAAIVDQVSLTFPNQTFVQTATRTLEQANYTVDYYSGDKVTVDFYRSLPTRAYSIIVLRVHSAIGQDGTPPVTFFTSEPYSQYTHVNEQLADELAKAHYVVGAQEEVFFAVNPNFVRSCRDGRFQNSTIVMMGCNGLTFTDMAEAFVGRGAKAYISWTGSVSASHTDQAATQLLKHLVTEGQTISQALENTAWEVPSDDASNSVLKYYPFESGNYAIQG